MNDELDPIKFRHLTKLDNGYHVSSIGEFMLNGKIHTIGVSRFYETMVFNGSDCDDLDFLGANTKEECLKNHEELIKKWREK
jgi:hypothetical protein